MDGMLSSGHQLGRLTFAATTSIKYERSRIGEADHDVLFSEQDLIRCLKCNDFRNDDISCYWIHNNRINPSLSFRALRGKAEKFTDVQSAYKDLKRNGFQSPPSDDDVVNGVLRRYNYLIVSSGIKHKLESYSELLACLSEAAARSINATNAVINVTRRIHSNLNGIVSGNRDDDYHELLKKSGLSFQRLINKQTFLVGIPRRLDEVADVSIELLEPQVSDTVIEPQPIRAAIWQHKRTLLMGSNEPITLSLPIELNETESNIIVHRVVTGGSLSNMLVFVGILAQLDVRNEDVLQLSNFATSFEDIFTRTKRLSVISGLRGHTKSHVTPHGGQTHSRIRQIFQSYVSDMFRQVFSLVDCHSTSLRLYDPCDNSLKSFCAINSSDGETFSSLSDEKSIGLRKYRDSANAFTYLIGHKKFEYVYIRNVNSPIPKAYKDFGLNSTYSTRPKTTSELCFPFYFQESVIGTLNIESSSRGAFDDDLDFLLMFKSSLEDFYRKLFEFEDLGWTRQLTRFADPMHELSNYMDTGFFTRPQKEVLKRLFFEPRREFREPESQTVGQLRSWVFHWIRSYFDKESADLIEIISDIVEINGSADVVLDQSDRKSVV